MKPRRGARGKALEKDREGEPESMLRLKRIPVRVPARFLLSDLRRLIVRTVECRPISG
jgi:hypothetical protein